MATKLFALHSVLSTILFYALSVLFLMPSARGKVATVGGSKGWTNFDMTTSSSPNYQAWASSHNIFPGDVVVFNYAPLLHNVYSLPDKLAFDNCNFAMATVLDSGASGIFTWIAPSRAGLYYFACSKSFEGLGSHCTAGQKIAITVSPEPNALKRIADSSPVRAPEVSTPSPSPHSQSPSHSHPTSAPSPFHIPPVGSPHSPLHAPAHPPSHTPISSIPSIATPTLPPAPRVVPILAPAAHSITPVAPRASSPSPIHPPSTPPTLPPPPSHTPLPSPHSHAPTPTPSIPAHPAVHLPLTPTLPPAHTPTTSPVHSPSVPSRAPALTPTLPPAHTPTTSPVHPPSVPSRAPELTPTLPPAHTPTTPPLPSPSIPSKAPALLPASPVLQPAVSPELAPEDSPEAPVTSSPESFPAASPGPGGSKPKSAGTQSTPHWLSAFFLGWAVFFLLNQLQHGCSHTTDCLTNHHYGH
ncbi:hypothetical protein O6H91_15G069500 [Diphasiastrum complanatum]|uniref:Uncharacterized protein n=2 Tax=Diphasiastrum complanatum TaxID=34168 RepID=A0ACC2BJH0_DIPCM|nr:hypothetical protein O6H91_15G069500 [Diphasiastrum complanatum]KAJ7529868.1 hypothetical protein O6H91_15G069500 [Diphasiastrum complanatum]